MSSDTGYAESLVEAIYSLSRPRKETNPLLWLCEIESTQFEDSPLLCMLAAWTCVTTARLADADRWTKALERVMAQEENKAAISPELASFAVKCLRMKYLAMAGDGTRALQLCDELLNCGQEVKPSLRSMINQSEAEAYESTGNYEQAMELYLKAQASATVDNTMHQLFFNEYTYALALYYRGEHADALKCCEDILKKCPEDFAIYGASCSLLARVLIEVDEIDRVPELIDTSLNRLSHYRHIDLYLDIKMAQSIWLASRGRASDAYEAIVEATIHGEQYEHVPRATLLSAYYLQAGMAKKQRNTRELKIIEQKFSNIVHDEDLFNQLLLLTIRAYILELDDRKREAATMFDQAFTQAHAKNFNRMGLNALVEKTMLLSALGEKTKTQAALSELIHVASKQGFARTILSAGEPLRQLLRDFSTSRNANGPMRTFTKALLLKFEKERPSTEGRPNGDEGLFANDASELTEREVEVLKLLNMGMQRQEIAEVLCISINTVKKHLANIYTKLGVKSRNEAIERITL
ncbi:MAG: LuxR C-terminal-related transcriptional regulator [Eggerthellaceae bacterium]|nr:LuxR C-terminal-related transcriptional regulator [Eggerthellaceae bacterium]